MPLVVSDVDKDELRDIVIMLFKAYDRSSAFVNAVYPHELTNSGIEGLDMVVARLQYLRDVDSTVRWYKVTDSETGAIVSASQWNIYDEKPSEVMLDGPPGAWATDADKRYAIEMFTAFIGPRYARYREVDTPIICLNIMGTAKAYQRQGAATLQVKKAVGIADKLNALTTTESTAEAVHLYEKNGFVVTDVPGRYCVEAESEEFSTKPKEWLFFMERPRAM